MFLGMNNIQKITELNIAKHAWNEILPQKNEVTCGTRALVQTFSIARRNVELVIGPLGDGIEYE